MIEVFNATMTYINKHPKTPEHDQQIFCGKLFDKLKKDGNQSVKVHALDKNMFPIGSDYFVRGIIFAFPCVVFILFYFLYFKLGNQLFCTLKLSKDSGSLINLH